MSKQWNLVAHYESGSSDKVYMACIRRNSDGTYTVLGKWGRRGRTFSSQMKGTFQTEAAAVAEAKSLFAAKLKKGYVDIESPVYDGPVTYDTPCVEENLEGDAEDDGRTFDIADDQRCVVTGGKRKRYLNGPASITLEANETATLMKCGCGNDRFNQITDTKGKRVFICKSCNKAWTNTGKAIQPDGDADDDIVTCVDNSGMEDRFDGGVEYVSEPHSDPKMIYVYDKLGEKQECFAERFKKAVAV